MSKRRLLLVLAAVVAAFAVLAGGAAAWWHWDTGRQPQVADVVTEMNRAVADVVVAAGPDAAFAVSPVVRSAECHLGFLRQGGAFTAKADLYTDAGAEDALITTIAGHLPTGYAVTRGPSVAGVRSLRATVGSAVTLGVQRLSSGWLSVTARSGCSLGTATPPPPAAAGQAATAVTDLLRNLGTAPATLTQQQVQCAQGDIVTVAAVSQPVDSADLTTRLKTAIPPGAHQFAVPDANRVVYRTGTTAVIIAASDDGTAVTAQYTTLC